MSGPSPTISQLVTVTDTGARALTLLNSAPGSDTGQVAIPVRVISSLGGGSGGGDASAANQTTEITKLTSIDGKVPALGQALAASSVPVVLTAAQLTTLTPLSSVSVSNFPATQAVSLASVPSHAVTNAGTFAVQVTSAPTTAVTGTFWQATQPVSGTVTANAGSGTMAVSGPLTDTQLRASVVSVHDGGTRTISGSYRCGSGQIAGAASAQNLISIENPAASGKTVWIKRIEIQGPTVTVSLTLKFLYLVGRTTGLPTVGTTLTSQKHATSDATAVAIVRQGPTATAATGNMWSTSGEQLFTAVGAGNPTQNIGLGETRETDDIVLAAGEGLLIRAELNNTGYFHSVDVSWEEGT